uniref:Uncharacterized protein n=1 Tax=Romanomermis culicivorax TaxID=13658 RepID=A0A915KFN6_ROMCU
MPGVYDSIGDIDGQSQDLALLQAIRTGDLELAVKNLGKGADVNAKNENSDSALHIAVSLHRPDIVRTLIDHRAILDTQNREGFTALDLAKKLHFNDLVLLLEKTISDSKIDQFTGQKQDSQRKEKLKRWHRMKYSSENLQPAPAPRRLVPAVAGLKIFNPAPAGEYESH